MSDQRYGKRNVSKMIREIEILRHAIRAEGTPDIQAAWDAVEEHIDYAYRALPAVQPDRITCGLPVCECGMIGPCKAPPPAVQPDAAAIREAALHELADELEELADELYHLSEATRFDMRTRAAGIRNALVALLNTPTGKEVMPDEANDPRHTQSDTAPAGLSAGGGAEPTAVQPHVNETPKSEHDAANMLTPATKGGDA